MNTYNNKEQNLIKKASKGQPVKVRFQSFKKQNESYTLTGYYKGSVPVDLPVEDFIPKQTDFSDLDEDKYLSLRLGQTYSVKPYFDGERFKASRLEVMRENELLTFFNDDEKYRQPLEAVIRAVLPNRLWVEVGGIETEVEADEVSMNFLSSFRDFFGSGEKTQVKITDLALNKNTRTVSKISVSRKLAYSEESKKLFDEYEEEMQVTGLVINHSEKGFVVDLENGLTMLAVSRSLNPKAGERVNCKIFNKDEKSNKLYGAILGTHLKRDVPIY